MSKPFGPPVSLAQLKVAFANDFFIAIDKDCGVLSTPARFQDEDSRPCLGTYLQAQLKIQIFPVHRLDFEVSGLVLYAKNAEAHRAANMWFENKQVHKTYRALTAGRNFEHLPAQVIRREIDPVEGEFYEWKCRLLRGKKRSFESPHGKESLTRAKYLGMQKDFHAWDLNPITGRSHQLRYEMSRHGYVILGDKLYGSKVDLGPDKVALRSYQIDFSKAPGAEKFQLPKILEIDPAI